jgi:hypothetical protein
MGNPTTEGRRPPLNYKDMNIPLGSKLVYIKDDNSVEVEVCGDKKDFFLYLQFGYHI